MEGGREGGIGGIKMTRAVAAFRKEGRTTDRNITRGRERLREGGKEGGPKYLEQLAPHR